MALTRHGYHILGSGEDIPPLPPKARCGGPGLCIQCNEDVRDYKAPIVEVLATDEPTLVKYPTPYANVQYCLKCNVLVSIKADRCPICDPQEG